MCVHATGSNEAFVTSFFDQPAVLHDDDVVSDTHRGESMCNSSAVALFAISRRRSKISISASGSIEAVGASSTTTGACLMKARASATFCHWPNEAGSPLGRSAPASRCTGLVDLDNGPRRGFGRRRCNSTPIGCPSPALMVTAKRYGSSSAPATSSPPPPPGTPTSCAR